MVVLAPVGGRHQPCASGRPRLPLGGHACHCGLQKPRGHAMLGIPDALRIACTHEKRKNTHAHRYVSVHGLTHVHGSMLAHWTACAARLRPRAATHPLPADLGKATPCPRGCPLPACASWCALPGTAACLLQRRWRCYICGASAPTPPRCSVRPTPASWAVMPASRRRRPVLSTGRTAKRTREGGRILARAHPASSGRLRPAPRRWRSAGAMAKTSAC